MADYRRKNRINPYFWQEILPEKKEITIDQIRQVKGSLRTSAGQTRCFVFYNFDDATVEAQNALLKTLEEKNDQNQFILTGFSLGRILPTVQSRSRIIDLDRSDRGGALNEGKASLLSAVAGGSDLKFLADPAVVGSTRENTQEWCLAALQFFEDRLGSDGPRAAAVVRKILQINNLLKDNNLNAQLALDELLIFISKTYRVKL